MLKYIAFITVLISASALSAPAITGVSGSVAHGGSYTITGTGFGTKATAAPIVWDDASTGTAPTEKWDLCVPSSAGTSYNMAYRTVTRGIPMPHSRVTRYIAGAHSGTGAYGGQAVMCLKNRTISSFPAYTFISWYERADDNWVFDGGGNYKWFVFNQDTGPYNLPYNWYIDIKGLSSKTSGTWATINDDTSTCPGQSNFGWCTLWNPDFNGHGNNWNSVPNPMGGNWFKREIEVKYTNQNDGFIRQRDNGNLTVNYLGSTDKWSGTSRSEGWGGYSSASSQTSNWRYHGDVYLDYSLQRVLLGNASTLASSTSIREVQIPTAWSDTSVTVTGNLGNFTDGQTAYLYVYDATGTANASGYSVTLSEGGGGDILPPILTITGPSASLPSNTTSTNLTLNTDEAATCKFTTIPNVIFGSKNTFATTGSTSHSQTVNYLKKGNIYHYYVACSDSLNNVSNDSLISFYINTQNKKFRR